MAERKIEALEEKAHHVAERLGMLANPRRLLILCRLAEGESSVGKLQETLDLGQSALSQHLAKLRAAGMVSTRRSGQTVYYRIEDPEVRAIMAALYDTFCGDG